MGTWSIDPPNAGATIQGDTSSDSVSIKFSNRSELSSQKFTVYFKEGTKYCGSFVVNQKGGKQPSPTPTPTPTGYITINVTIVNHLTSSITLDGDCIIIADNPDVDGVYRDWQGSFVSLKHQVFSSSPVTLGVNESRSFSITWDGSRRKPLPPSKLPNTGYRKRNIEVYVGGNAEYALPDNWDDSIMFEDGQSWTIDIKTLK